MLVIRLARTGRKKYPTYRLVAAEKQKAATGKFVSILGHYNPHTKEFVVKKDETEQFLKNGAQPSNSVIRLLEKEKVSMPKWASYHSKNKPAKKEAKPEATAASEAPEAEKPADTEQPAAVGAEAAAEQVAQVAENVEDKNVTETAEVDQKQEQAAEKAEEVAAEAAVQTPEPEKPAE